TRGSCCCWHRTAMIRSRTILRWASTFPCTWPPRERISVTCSASRQIVHTTPSSFAGSTSCSGRASVPRRTTTHWHWRRRCVATRACACWWRRAGTTSQRPWGPPSRRWPCRAWMHPGSSSGSTHPATCRTSARGAGSNCRRICGHLSRRLRNESLPAKPGSGYASCRAAGRAGRVASGELEAPELPAGADVELLEDAAQVGFDGAWTQEQLGTDLAVSRSCGDQPGDVQFLGGECVGRLRDRFAQFRAGRPQFVGGTCGERLRPHDGEHPVCGPELFAGILAAVFPAKPLTVDKMGACSFSTHPGS